MLKCLLSITIFLYLGSVFITGTGLDLLVSFFSIAIIIYTLFLASRFVRILGLFFLTLGTILLIFSDIIWKDYLLSFGLMLNLLSLFAIVPILALPIRLGNYPDIMQTIVQKRVKTSGQLYMVTSGISYFFSCFMNLATLPMTYYSVRPSVALFDLKNEERFMTRAVIHGFSMPLLWAPVTPIVGIVIEMNNVSWGSMLPYLIPISLMGLLIDWFLGLIISNRRSSKHNAVVKSELAATVESSNEGRNAGQLTHILLAIIIFLSVILFIEFQFAYGFLSIVTILVIPFSLAWSITLGKSKGFFKGLKEYYNTHLLKLKDQFFIFLSAGFFISAVRLSGTDHIINTWISGLSDFIGIGVFLTFLPLVPLVLSFLGLHPAVSLALMAEALDPKLLGISAQILTISMLGGAVAAFLMGPYNATIGLMSSIAGKSPFHISRWNVLFTICYLGMIMLVLIILQMIV
jgi:hypothetical protein